MSEYLRVLSRIDAATRSPRAAAPASAPDVDSPGRAPEPETGAAAGEPAVVRLPVARLRFEDSTRAGALAAVYDAIRASTGATPARALVVAAADDPVGLRGVVEGLALQARRRGQRVRLAELTDGSGTRLLRLRSEGDGDEPVLPGPLAPLALRGNAQREDVRAWLSRLPASDVVLVDGGSLARSVDGALVACGCDGLVIVARAGATSRDLLRRAAERAAAVGCRTLGLVLEVHPGSIPPWRRRAGGAGIG